MRKLFKVLSLTANLFAPGVVRAQRVYWFKRDRASFLSSFVSDPGMAAGVPEQSSHIEAMAVRASQLGDMPLWKGFEELKDYPFEVKNATRNANQVRVGKKSGEFFYRLTCARRPKSIIEIGTAFGVSGMYWLSGIKSNGLGHLYTFEPNEVWANVAKENLQSVSDAFTLTVDTFENHHSTIVPPEGIDMAFIDAIHTSEVVNSQNDLIRKYTNSGSIILYDDINFSEDMWNCWVSIAKSDYVRSSCSVFDRIGVVELK